MSYPNCSTCSFQYRFKVNIDLQQRTSPAKYILKLFRKLIANITVNWVFISRVKISSADGSTSYVEPESMAGERSSDLHRRMAATPFPYLE